MGWALNPTTDVFTEKRERFSHRNMERSSHVTTKAETGVIRAKECQGMPADARKKLGWDGLPLRASKQPALPSLNLGPLAS